MTEELPAEPTDDGKPEAATVTEPPQSPQPPQPPPAPIPPAPPMCAVFLRANGVGEVLIDDQATPISCTDLPTARRQAVEVLAAAAKSSNASLIVICSDPEGLFRLLVAPDGTVSEAPRDMTGIEPPQLPYMTALPSLPLPPTTPFATRGLDPYDDHYVTSDPVITPRHAFTAPSGAPLPARQGWRGALARRGIPLPPSEAEMTDRSYRATVSQHWGTPRTIAVVNGKGGAGKTPTTICLAAVFARFGGTGVLAWDNNQTRGTLGWRTEQGPHESTLLDLLPQVPRLLAADAQAVDLARFVHHQDRDHFDVLRSKSHLLADEQRITPHDVDAIWRVATKYYRLIIMDSGNDESDPMWRRMIDHTDQLVTVTTTRADHAEAGALLLEALARRNEFSARLARNSVTIITQADPKASDESIRRIRDGYADLTRDVELIPYDPAMVEGALSYDHLKPGTQRAWLAAAASVAEGLS